MHSLEGKIHEEFIFIFKIMNFIDIVLDDRLTSIDNWFALELNGIKVEDSGVTWVD